MNTTTETTTHEQQKQALQDENDSDLRRKVKEYATASADTWQYGLETMHDGETAIDDPEDPDFNVPDLGMCVIRSLPRGDVEGIIITLASGGPRIELDTYQGVVHGWSWGTYVRESLGLEAIERIDEWGTEIANAVLPLDEDTIAANEL